MLCCMSQQHSAELMRFPSTFKRPWAHSADAACQSGHDMEEEEGKTIVVHVIHGQCIEVCLDSIDSISHTKSALSINSQNLTQ